MALEIVDDGENNDAKIGAAPNLNGRVRFRGNNSRFKVGAPYAPGDLFVAMGSNCSVFIGKNALFKRMVIDAADGSDIEIGDNVGINGAIELYANEPSTIKIGERCLFGGNVSIITSDSHAIFDIVTGRRVNFAKSVTLGKRVWVGAGAMIMKGATIGDFSIIGARSVVSGNIPPLCAAAGNPARVVRENVAWCRDLRDDIPAEVARDIGEFQKAQSLIQFDG